MRNLGLTALAASLLASPVQGFQGHCPTNGHGAAATTRPHDWALSAADTPPPSITTTRSAFLASAAFALIAAPQTVQAASEADPALKGTKQDPAYEACVSKCLYECTKPKGMEQKSRQECRPECKQQCATTKEQLMIGTPLKK